jgi:hypothetical protein
MRKVLAFFGLLSVLVWPHAVSAKVQVAIDLTSQTMHVESAEGAFNWPISSARSGFSTPHGSYQPYSLQRMHYSHKYHMSPMPYSIFFLGGYAIHGTYSTAELGRPASHGCIRLAPGNAAQLFKMVQAEGAAISIAGTPPASRGFYAKHTTHRHHAVAFAKAHHHHGHMFAKVHRRAPTALGYAPHHDVPNVQIWQANPSWAW